MTDSGYSVVEADSVYRVLHVIGTHPDGWEQAASAAIADLCGTISDLRVARVVRLDVARFDQGDLVYRVMLSVSHRIDRRRVLADGAVATVRRILVVANRTAGGPELMAAVRARLAAGPAEFHVLVPVAVPTAAGAQLWGEPLSGYGVAADAEADADAGFAWAAAEERLEQQLTSLRGEGAVATGELRPADPLKASLDVLGRSSFDEVIVSTLPVALSRWLRLDLPRRLARQTSLPVTHIEQLADPAR